MTTRISQNPHFHTNLTGEDGTESTPAVPTGQAQRTGQSTGQRTANGRWQGIRHFLAQLRCCPMDPEEAVQERTEEQFRPGNGSSSGNVDSNAHRSGSARRGATNATNGRDQLGPDSSSNSTGVVVPESNENINRQMHSSEQPYVRSSTPVATVPVETTVPRQTGQVTPPRNPLQAQLVATMRPANPDRTSPQIAQDPSTGSERSGPGQSFSADSVLPIHSYEKVVLRERTFFNSEAIPLLPYSQTFLKKYKSCRAWNNENIFVAGPDGKVRRFPVDDGVADRRFIRDSDGMPEWIGKSLAKQLHIIYDAPRDKIRQTLAEYEVDPEKATMTFKVGDRSVQSIVGHATVFPLSDGKYMIPQPEFRDCTYACEEMLLAEGKSVEEVTEQVREFKSVGNLRQMEEICASLKRRSGRRPEMLKGNDMTTADSLKTLKKHIAQHGPCILDGGGHVRILDNIEGSGSKHILTVRDPFSASFLKIMDYDGIWGRPDDRMAENTNRNAQEPLRNWTAIFLT